MQMNMRGALLGQILELFCSAEKGYIISSINTIQYSFILIASWRVYTAVQL